MYIWCCGERPKRRTSQWPTNPPKPIAPTRPPISLEPREQQLQCPLFSPQFPAELRLKIYEAVLGDTHRLMHVIPFEDESDRVGRQRCEDMSCEGPTWQHKCFGIWSVKNGTRRGRKFEFWSYDKLLALPLSCHRIYLESIDILYMANIFSVKGGRGIAAFKAVTPAPQWQLIRHLNVSTMFLTPQSYWQTREFFPPENYSRWSANCASLAELHGLRSLLVEIAVWDTHDRESAAAVEEEALVTILNPLNQLSPPRFEVEINMDIPDTVIARLGKIAFTLIVKQRPFDRKLFQI